MWMAILLDFAVARSCLLNSLSGYFHHVYARPAWLPSQVHNFIYSWVNLSGLPGEGPRGICTYTVAICLANIPVILYARACLPPKGSTSPIGPGPAIFCFYILIIFLTISGCLRRMRRDVTGRAVVGVPRPLTKELPLLVTPHAITIQHTVH